jgi:glycerophosphoryl diester phosphodiesterase
VWLQQPSDHGLRSLTERFRGSCAKFLRMSRRWISVAVLAAFAGVLAIVAFRKGAARTLRTDWPVDFAHRGASLRAPENTMEAFRAAIEAGAAGLELDVHMTRDGQIVVVHDPTVDRTTDGSGAVREMALEEIRSLDAGYRFRPNGDSAYPYRGRGRGLRVPTLEEVFREFPDAAVNIEIKEARSGIERAVLSVIEEAGAGGRTLVASGQHEVIERFRRASEGRIPTAASRREIQTFYLLSRLHLEGFLRPPYDALQVPVSYRGLRLVTPRFVRAAHHRGVRVDVWTIDDPSEMRFLLDLGVDVVMTDRPETLLGVLEERR